jgi:hypothetical protein
MTERGDAIVVDGFLAQLPPLLLERGLKLRQKRSYKAGKLSATRNWCQLVDRDMPLRVVFPNYQGKVKTWKLFARFNTGQPPAWPWDRPELYEGKKAQWVLAGSDVWGVAYEDIREWSRRVSDRQLLERLASDLQVSFDYSRQCYC